MEHEVISKKNAFSKTNKRNLLMIIGAIIILVCIVAAFLLLIQPERSVANFCKVAKEEKSNFKANTGYNKLLGSFKKLDGVAPNEIHLETSLIVKGYESIVNDPSKSVSSELGISDSQMRVSDYITKNCPDF